MLDTTRECNKNMSVEVAVAGHQYKYKWLLGRAIKRRAQSELINIFPLLDYVILFSYHVRTPFSTWGLGPPLS